VQLIVAAFLALSDRRLVVAGDGPDAIRVRTDASPNSDFVEEGSRERILEFMRAALAFVFAAEEGFGVLPVEAQAGGIPVIELVVAASSNRCEASILSKGPVCSFASSQRPL
jgi:glycosyltransferase involved in cell wall biosynthesis